MTNEYLTLLRRWMGCTDRRELYRIEARMAEITGWRPRHGTEEADDDADAAEPDAANP